MTRGVERIYPTKEELEKLLLSGKRIKLYQGFDPTGPDLHLGHLVGLLKLKQFQDLGHEVIFLIGNVTATIGDPSGKTTARKILPRDQVEQFAKSYKTQASKILNFGGENPVKVKYNGEWYDKMNALELAKITNHLTFAQVMERDLFQERQKSGQDVYINEFIYPALQAYDSVVLDVDLEVGGSDQMFNMMMGRKLMRNMKQKEKFVMTLSLLVDSMGNKIGKTEGNVVALDSDPKMLFGAVMNFPDDVIIKSFELITNLPVEEIESVGKSLVDGMNPRDAKIKLATEIVTLLHSKDEAEIAEKYFNDTFSKKIVPDDILEISLSAGENLPAKLVEVGIISSGNEWRRLISSGAVETESGEKISDINYLPKENTVLKIGKKRFVKIVL